MIQRYFSESELYANANYCDHCDIKISDGYICQDCKRSNEIYDAYKIEVIKLSDNQYKAISKILYEDNHNDFYSFAIADNRFDAIEMLIAKLREIY